MNKTILVTGASSGIGKAIAKKLINEGHTVYTAARRIEQMEDLSKMGGIPLKMDITKDEDVRRVVDTISEQHEGVDVLVNNAGYGLYGAVEEISIDDARRQFDVNLFGLARLTKMVIPYMRRRQKGAIINMSSMGGKVYTPLGAWYHATKHALEGWSDCLRLELKPFGIDVVIVEPGVIDTEFGDVMLEPMLERSSEGPYREMTQKVVDATRQTYEDGNSSPVTVIADVVARAIRSDRPKTRYAAGKFAKPMMFIRKYLGDRLYDKIIMQQFK